MTQRHQRLGLRSESQKALSKKVLATLQQAVALHNRGDLSAAQALYEKVLATNPGVPDAMHLLGTLHGAQGRSEQARSLIERAIKANPGVAAYHHNLGVVLESLADLDSAAESLVKATVLSPRYVDAWDKLAGVQVRLGKFADAIESYQRVLELAPRDVCAWSNLAGVFTITGEVENALFCYRTALQIDPNSPIINSNYLFTSNYDETASSSAHYELHRKFGELLEARPGAPALPPNPSPPGAKLRLGFVSGDFRHHPVGFFLESVLSQLDRDRFSIFLYPTIDQQDEVSQRFRALSERWTSLWGLDDDAAAALINDDQIDILVDLAGHTGNNRLGIFARRPAPVQVTWLGYFATTGLSAIDYILVDSHLCAPDDQRFFSEKLLFLPRTRLCFTPPDVDLDVNPLPALTNGVVTFGCFNNLAKLNAQVIRTWSAVLVAVPGARLLIKAQGLSDVSVRERLATAFAEHGVGAERLLFEGWTDRRTYLAAYHQVDIALDPYPFTGGTTSVEALWMGVPVLTLCGDRMVSRQGGSMLANLQLGEWIAPTEEAYVSSAARYAADLPVLSQLRQTLRPRLLASPLCDARSFARDLAGAFLVMRPNREGGQ